jgi:hypothetical protein
MLSRIIAIRFKAVRVSEARGGLGGTSGRGVTGISQDSAMLTGRPRKKLGDEIGVSSSYQLWNPGAMKAPAPSIPSDGIWTAIGWFCGRARFPYLCKVLFPSA